MKKKSILVSQRLISHDQSSETREALDIRVGKFLSSCGFVPVPVSLLALVGELFDSVKPVGVCLTGGNNLPSLEPDNPLNDLRHELEKLLIERAIQDQVPIFGICHGMQMLADHFGASFKKEDGHVNRHHSVEVIKNSLLAASHPSTVTVNSFHDYCVRTLSDKSLHASAVADDGTIEAIEHQQHAILGIMWHPERVEPFDARDIQLVQNFFNLKLAVK
jgi:N5-(cytidine 5'-diphosphoramidyl)-L-glutamine hydrolase